MVACSAIFRHKNLFSMIETKRKYARQQLIIVSVIHFPLLNTSFSNKTIKILPGPPPLPKSTTRSSG